MIAFNAYLVIGAFFGTLAITLPYYYCKNKKKTKEVFKQELKETYSDYPTKEEFLENVKKIQEKELNSDKFKAVKDFIERLNKRENLDLEKRLFKIVGTYGLDDDLINKSYVEKKISKLKRYEELKNFINSLTKKQISSNLYLTAASKFMETSIIDCNTIIEQLRNQIANLEIGDEIQRLEINISIPKERLDMLPTSIREQTSCPYYRPQAYKTEYVYLLDNNNRHIYKEYNKYVINIEKILEDIYGLQMWNILSMYPEQIDNYLFSVINNEFDQYFITAFKVKKYKDNKIVGESKTEEKQVYKISEETKNNISRVIGLPFDKIISMDPDDLEKYIEARILEKAYFDKYKDNDEDKIIIKK